MTTYLIEFGDAKHDGKEFAHRIKRSTKKRDIEHLLVEDVAALQKND